MLDGLVAAYPSVTAIDIGPLLVGDPARVGAGDRRGAVSVRLHACVGVLVLYAALLAGTRGMRESALLRALGASHRQVRAVQVAGVCGCGALAGLMAAVGAQVLGSVAVTRVFDFYLDLDPWLLPAGIAAGVACVGVGGWPGSRRVLQRAGRAVAA